MSEYEIKALTSDTWDAFAALASRHGGAGMGGCWCTWFHRETHSGSPTGTAEGCPRLQAWSGRDRPRPCRSRLRRRPGGGLGPVRQPGRASRDAHRKEYLEADALPDHRITCFFVDRLSRRSGVAAAALDGALALIAAAGGGVVEAYPQDTPGKKVSATFLYSGTRPMFERAGFVYQRPKERITAFCGRSSTQAEKPSFKEAACANLTGRAGAWISRPPAVRERRRHPSARVAQRSTDAKWQRVARLPHYLS